MIFRELTNTMTVDRRSTKSLLALLATLDQLDEDFPSMPDPVPDPIDISETPANGLPAQFS